MRDDLISSKDFEAEEYVKENVPNTASRSPFRSHSSGCFSSGQYMASSSSTVSSVIEYILSFNPSSCSISRLNEYISILCLFMTSSYSRRCFLMSKLCASTLFCEFSIALDTSLFSIGMSSSMPSLFINPEILSEPNIRIRSSSNDK